MNRLLLSMALVTMAGVTVGRAQEPANDAGVPGYVLETKETERVRAVLTYTVSCPDLLAREWVAFAAVAPELPGQMKTRTVLSPAGTLVKDRSPLARDLLMARIPARSQDLLNKLAIQVSYEATLRSRALKPRPAQAEPVRVAPLTLAERERYLAERGDMDFKRAAFQKWLQQERLTRGADQGEIDFARQAFLHIRARMRYEYRSDLDRRASVVCSSGKSDCGGLSALFVAVLRANGMPARVLFGRWAQSAERGARLGGQGYFQAHAKAEFFAQAVGWVPVDLAGAIVHDRSPEGLAYFGVDPGDFLIFHVDSDLSLDTALFGVQSVYNLQNPAWWVQGRGSVQPRSTSEDWTVTRLK